MRIRARREYAANLTSVTNYLTREVRNLSGRANDHGFALSLRGLAVFLSEDGFSAQENHCEEQRYPQIQQSNLSGLTAGSVAISHHG
jgi:hypothetical protein